MSNSKDASSIIKKLAPTFTIDNLFPSSSNKSGTKGKRLDIETIFLNTPLNTEPDVSFSTEVLLDRINARRKKKLWYFKIMLKYCYDRIESADGDQITDILFKVIDVVPDCKGYDSLECLEYISDKLRKQCFDTLILDNTTMFVSWKYLELNKDNYNDDMEDDAKETKLKRD